MTAHTAFVAAAATAAVLASHPCVRDENAARAITQITPPGVNAENPEWFPSGDAIAFATGEPLRVAIVDVSAITRTGSR